MSLTKEPSTSGLTPKILNLVYSPSSLEVPSSLLCGMSSINLIKDGFSSSNFTSKALIPPKALIIPLFIALSKASKFILPFSSGQVSKQLAIKLILILI